MRNQYKYKRLAILLVLAFTLAAVATVSTGTVSADAFDPTQTGCLKFAGHEEQYKQDLLHAPVYLYQIARARSADNGSGDYVYDLLPGYEDLAYLLPNDTSYIETDSKQGLANEAAKRILDSYGSNPIECTQTGEFCNTFTELETGLYVIIIGERPEGEIGVATEYIAGTYTYRFSPLLASLPALGTGGNNTDGGGSIAWQYEYTIFVKAQQSDSTGRLKILSILNDYIPGHPATVVYEVNGVRNGELVYSNVVSMTFTGPGTKEKLLTGIPVGAVVTVSLVYPGENSGLCYQLIEDRSGTYTIMPQEEEGEEGPPVAEFVFASGDGANSGGSVIFRYEKQGTGLGYTADVIDPSKQGS